jgi:tetratricopeptide (TPR) repeat protein
VLFTDLVGSTELMTQLGEAAFDELRRGHFAALRAPIEQAGGEEIKNTGDGVMVVFGSVVEALQCAVAMQQATNRQSRSGPVPLAIRVGLSLGEVTFEDGDVFGTPVVEAARLVAAARPGQILASAVIRLLGGSRAPTSFSDLGALELKGLPEPLPVCEVAWEPLASPTALPLPAFFTSVGRVFVGREAELDRLAQLWKEAAAGERRVALLAGEPGIGKTRLATELAISAHAGGAVVLAGRCDEEMGVPYQPFVEALRHCATHAAVPRLGRHAGELARLVPELSQLVPGLPEPLRSDPETERYRLFDALAAWLGDLSAAAPVLLVLDDLHWAAKPTLLLLRHVLRSTEALRLLVVVTYRDTDIGRGHPLANLLADMRREVGVDRISLPGLDQTGVATFLQATAGHALNQEGEDLARAIWAETEGNPFFVGEVLRHLSESGRIQQRDGQWMATRALEDLGIPEGVREVVGRRLSRLSETANRVLGVAAVVGQEFEAPVVLAAGRLDEDDLFRALDEAVTARLLSEAPGPVSRYRFAHGLVRATLYEELSGAHRVGLHRRVAEAIETLHAGGLEDHLPALAHHWARAAAPAAETAKAVEYAKRAGDRALAQLAHDEAASYYRQALELLDAAEGPRDDAGRLELLIALGEAQRRAADPVFRETLLDAAHLAESRGDGPGLARAALAGQRGMYASGVGVFDAERVRTVEAALQAVGVADTPIRARLLAVLAEELIYQEQARERRTELSREAVALARRLGDPATLARVLLNRQYTIMTPDTLAERLAENEEILGLAETLGDPAMTTSASLLRARAAMEQGDAEESSARLQTAERLADELGQPVLRWMAQVYRANRLTMAGRLEEADQLVEATGELGAGTRQPDARLFLYMQRYQLRLERGSLEEMEPDLEALVAEDSGIPAFQAMLALCRCHGPRPERARSLLAGLADGDFTGVPFHHLWLFTLATAAWVATTLEDEDRAATLHELLVPYSDQVISLAVNVSGSVAHYLGLVASTLGRFDEAEERFAAAEATHERIGAPTWLARTRLEWARMLLTRRNAGDAERARELLGQALTSARGVGLANIERRAVELLSSP